MSRIDMSANRKYMINDDWLVLYGENGRSADRNRYVDFEEIKKNPSGSQYIQDLVAMGVITSADFDDESRKASFILNGIRVGRSDRNDTDGRIDGALSGDPLDRFQNYYATTINHPERFQRIWAWRTTARSIMFVGLDKTAHMFNT